jgi:hypothetical protein
MKFEVALAEIKKLADENPVTKGYFSIVYQLTKSANGFSEAKCQVYLHGYNFETGKTWDEAITKMRYAINPESVKPDFEEAPEEDMI